VGAGDRPLSRARFVLVDCHPYGGIFENEPGTKDFEVGYDYFGGVPIRFEGKEGTYAASARLSNATVWEWIHPLHDILGELLAAGLVIEEFHEYPFTGWKQFPFLEQRADGWWHFPEGKRRIPLLFSLTATKPAPRD